MLQADSALYQAKRQGCNQVVGAQVFPELRGVAMKEKQADPIKKFRAQWAVMTFYERFEQVIALALSAIIAVIIVVSLLQLISDRLPAC